MWGQKRTVHVEKPQISEIFHKRIIPEKPRSVERFSSDDAFRLSDLLQSLHSIKQGDRDLSSYFTDIQIIWQELDILRPSYTCICEVPSSCDLCTNIRKTRDHEYLICFLKGLNDNYNTMRRQILCMDPLPSVAKAFAMVQ